MARLRSAQSAPTSSPRPQRQTRQALKEKTNTTSTKSRKHVYENDGDTEELVKNVKPRRRVPRKSPDSEVDVMMAGGLGLLERASSAVVTEQAIDSVERSEYSGISEQRTAHSNRLPTRVTKTHASNMAQSKTKQALKQRIAAMAKQKDAIADTGRALNAEMATSPQHPVEAPLTSATRWSASEFDLSGDMFNSSSPAIGRLSTIKGLQSSLLRPKFGLKSYDTPAADTSTIVLKQFKHRPRQPSMLQLVQKYAINVATSTLHAEFNDEDSEFPLALDGEDDEAEDDFLPDAEGTPLNVRRAPRTWSGSGPSSSTRYSVAHPSKRSSDAMEPPSAVGIASRKRQRWSNPADVDDEPRIELVSDPVAISSSPEDQLSPQPDMTSDVQVMNSPPSSTPPSEPPSPGDGHKIVRHDAAVPSTEEQNHDYPPDVRSEMPRKVADNAYEAPNGTMAEPASSSPIPFEGMNIHTDTVDPAVRMTRPATKTGVKRQVKSKSKPLSSAALQSLLPKRRQRPKTRARKSEYDIVDSDDEPAAENSRLSDEDEDTSIFPRRRQTKSYPTKSRISTVVKRKARTSKAPAGKRHPPAAASRKSTATSKSAPKTYSRTSDKENDDYDSAGEELEDTSSLLPEVSMYEATKSKELEAIKRKFEEIDALDMDFETVDVEDHRSSSSQYR